MNDKVVTGPRVMVWYTTQIGDKATSARMIVPGAFDIRYEAEIARLEAHIQAKTGAETVMITNWRSLEG